MTQRNVTHATFVIERDYPASSARVFHALADPKAKARWFVGPDDLNDGRFEMDFRVGGREFNSGGPKGGPVYTYNALYQDIIENERIVYTYDMHLDDQRISVSLTTIEIKPRSGGTRLVLTEQGAYLDGFDDPKMREHGTAELLDALGAELARQSADT
jgi:uncharacterized protein YndB with AHSA1/START domain